MTQRKCYPASLLSNKNKRKNRNLQSGFSRSFCYSLAKSKRFCTFDTTAWRTKVKRSCGELGCTPFLAHHGPKNSLRFSTHFCGLEKIGANNAPKNCSTQFLLAHILLAKYGLRPSHESACDLSANHADKNERGHNPLPILTRLLL